MRLYIIRHGETDWNTKGRLQGQTDTRLNDKGIRLAPVSYTHLRRWKSWIFCLIQAGQLVWSMGSEKKNL